jgi:hypothetical protein
MTNPMTTTGDTIYSSSGSTPARLGIGTAGQVLQVNSGATAPEWATPAGGGGLTLLSTTSLTGSTVTVSSISGSYKNLRIFIKDVYGSVDNLQCHFRLNGDTGSNYAYGAVGIRVSGGAIISNASRSDTKVFYLNGFNATDYNQRGYATLFIPRYTDTARQYFEFNSYSQGDSTATNTISFLGTGVYNSSAAITSLTLLVDNGTFQGGTLYIYGEA